MKAIKNKLILFAIATVLCNCSKDKSPEGGVISRNGITLTDSVFCVSSNTSVFDVEVIATGGWRATSNATWITVDTKERNGSGKLTLTLSENTDKFYPREGTVSLVNEFGTRTVVVKQESCGVLTVNVGSITFKMIPVEHGTFQMGLAGDSDTHYGHGVTLTKDYHIGETEVTQGLWYAVMGQRPATVFSTSWSSEKGLGDDYPAYCISYDDCEQFLAKLNQMTGKNFRFPTEAEWEFAAKGGNKSKGYVYAGSNTIGDIAWYEDNSNRSTHKVKTKAPNELGLYDMTGNVAEWCYDWYSTAYPSEFDPTGPIDPPSYEPKRVIRGDGWNGNARSSGCTVAGRFGISPEFGYDTLGLRLAL